MPSKIGVLAVQGSFKEHLAAVARVGGDVIGAEVRVPEDLVDCVGLIIPGGESTAIAVCLEDAGLLKPVRAFAKTKPVWGIYAGLILLADKVDEPSANPALIGGLKITVKRNAFGRQIDSKFRALTLDKAAPAGLGSAAGEAGCPACEDKRAARRTVPVAQLARRRASDALALW